MDRRISVVIPCYNSSSTIEHLMPELVSVLSSISSSYEIILVNDGSRDNTWNILKGLTNEYLYLRAINLSKNFGQHNATLCGILEAKYEVVITIDDDLQNPPEEISRLIDKLESGFDVVYGVPASKGHGLIRRLGSGGLRLILRAVGAKSSEGVSSFRAFRSHLIPVLENTSGNVVCLDVHFSWTTDKFGTIKVAHRPRRRAVSSYTYIKLISFAVELILAYSSLPLKLIGFAGAVFALVGVAAFLACIVLVSSQVGSAMFLFVCGLLLLLGGFNLAGLGIIGEYLVRLHAAGVKQPSFKIAEDLSSKVEADTITRDSISSEKRTKVQA